MNQRIRKADLGKCALQVGRCAVKTLDWIIRHDTLVALVGCICLSLVATLAGHAQTNQGPITVYGRSDQDPLKGAKSLVSLLMWAMIITGIVLWCLVPINGGRDKPWMSKAIFGTIALGIGGWIALSDRIGKGDPLDLPDPLGR